jgi:hypothetical protein
MGFYWTHPRTGYFFFDPQDCVAAAQERKFPLSAKNATFEPLLKHYIGITQLLLTVSAACIAFGGNTQPNTKILIAKLILAWSICYGIFFCAELLWRYDEYGQDVTSLTPRWYSTIFACGFSSLTCFFVAYLVWSFGL